MLLYKGTKKNKWRCEVEPVDASLDSLDNTKNRTCVKTLYKFQESNKMS